MTILHALNTIVRTIESIVSWVGRSTAWLTTVLVLLICTDVIMRYAFSFTKAWVIELEWHLFALTFLLASAYALKEDQHVRVDVFYSKWSDKRKAWVNLVGTALFLIPWCLIIIKTGFQYADNSFAFRESSPDPGGLPARYIIKYSIVVGFVLLLLQAIAGMANSIQTIRRKSN